MLTTHYLIIGAGVMGLTIARELVNQGAEDILILEKEAGLGRHASGRNSGVLHAGIYYAPGTARARSCFEGNQLMKAFCREKGLKLAETGKVIVAFKPIELETLYELRNRALENGTEVELVCAKDLAEYEPNARTADQALYSPHTAQIDPKEVLQALHDELVATGKVRIQFETHFKGAHESKKSVVLTNKGDIEYRYLVNAGGAFSDKIAHAFDVGKQYQLLPFKGVYRKLKKEHSGFVRGNIYPVPNIKNPFLGVHFTKSVHGDVYLGPTAIPAFGRENYGIIRGLDGEFFSILARDAKLMLTNEKFRNTALDEIGKYGFKRFFEDAGRLVRNLKKDMIEPSSKVGIRPQLVDIETGELVMDFKVETRENSLHLLNAISPAFTSSMAFARMLVDEHILTN